MRNSTGQLAFLSGPRFILFPDPRPAGRFVLQRPVRSSDGVTGPMVRTVSCPNLAAVIPSLIPVLS